MTIQTIPLTKITAAEGNPRRSMDATALEGLAASIATDFHGSQPASGGARLG